MINAMRYAMINAMIVNGTIVNAITMIHAMIVK
jgi:hypothetical protein